MAEVKTFECDTCGATETGEEPQEAIPGWVHQRLQVRTFVYGAGSENTYVRKHYCPEHVDDVHKAITEGGNVLDGHLDALVPTPEPEGQEGNGDPDGEGDSPGDTTSPAPSW